MFCITIEHKSSCDTFSLIYCKNFTNFLFWVLWTCLATSIKSDNANLQKFRVHLHAKKNEFHSLRKPCQRNFGKFQGSGESRFGGSEKDRYFFKIPKQLHKIFRHYKQGKSVSYFLNNTAKICLYGLKLSENIEIEHVFLSKAFFHLSSNLHTSCLSAFNTGMIKTKIPF